MSNILFNKTVVIGEIEFKVSGKYIPKTYHDDLLEIEYDEIVAIVPTNDDLIEVDGKPILESFSGWDTLENELIELLEDDIDSDDADSEDTNIDDVDIDEEGTRYGSRNYNRDEDDDY